MPSIHIGLNASPLIALLFAVAGILAAFLFYRYTIPAVSQRLRLALTLLRSTALVILLLLILEPKLSLVRSWSQPPVLAVLADNSRSMRIIDATKARGAIETAVLRSPALRARSHPEERLFFSFGTRLREFDGASGDTLVLDEEATDISGAFRDLERIKDERHIAAVVLVGDGAYTSGAHPIYEAQRLGIPVFTIGVGDSSEHKDVSIARVTYNETVYSGVVAPVDVTVRSSGFGGERVEVELRDGPKVLDRSTVVLTPGMREYAVPLSFTPEAPGTRKYAVSVSALSGELTAVNNTRSFLVRVLKSKISVLIVAGAPGPDVAAIGLALREAHNFSVSSYTQKNGGGFFEGALTAAGVDSADCIVLIDMPTASTNDQTFSLLRNAFAVKGTPLFFIAGRDVVPLQSPAFTTSIGSFLPFTMTPPLSDERLIFFSAVLSQRLNPILAGGVSGGGGSWGSLPPVYLAMFRFRARPEAVVLGTAREQSVDTGIPLILTRSAGKSRSLAVMGYGVWRWRLMAQDSRATSDLFAGFLSASVQWLTTPEESRAVRISTSKQIFTQNEKVEFVGQAYDASARPVENARVNIVVAGGDRLYESSLHPIGEGRYEGSLEGLGEGDYVVRAGAEIDGIALGSDSSRFSIGALDLEFQDTRMNAEILRLIAYRTGGQYFDAEHIAGFGGALDTAEGFHAQEMQSVAGIDLWNWRATLIALIALFAAEWFLRKRNGML